MEAFRITPDADWFHNPATQAMFLAELRKQAAAVQFIEPAGDGDGIVYVGGGKFWPGIAVGCQLLRDFGCRLPIQVWYRGQSETINAEDVAGLDVELIDADEMSDRLGDNRVPRGRADLGGWEAKGYALTHSRFRRMLYLDADAYCVADPTPLFRRADPYAMLYWQDFESMAGNIRWPAVWPDGDRGVREIQGGQLLVNRTLCEAALQLMHWMCQRSDFYFQQMFGDQDCWRVALAITGAPIHNLGPARWESVAFVCELDGRPVIVHRCQGKLFRPEDIPDGNQMFSNPQLSLPHEGHVFDTFAKFICKGQTAEIFDLHYKRKLWGGGSGSGSAPEESRPYIEAVNALAKLAGWKSCVDVGCGDGRVANELSFTEYQGFDASAEAIAQFKKNSRRDARVLDCYGKVTDLPSADVLLIRDVLHHWPNEWVESWLLKVQGLGRWKAVVLCQDRHQWHDGQDTYVGGYRALNPRMKPMNQFPVKLLGEHLHKAILILA